MLGAGGNLGGKVADELLKQEANVHVLGRDQRRLSRFYGTATIVEGDVMDDAVLRQALVQVNSLFLTLPDEAFTDLPATAARWARLLAGTPVTHVVHISNSILTRGGTKTRLVALEEELDKRLPQHLLHVRSANFFENLNWGLDTPYKPDLALPYISAYEVAQTIAQHLLQLNFTGKSVRTLLGERDYTMAELAEAVGYQYTQQPYSPQNINFFKPFNEGDFTVAPRDAANTSSPVHEKFTLRYFLEHDLRLPQ